MYGLPPSFDTSVFVGRQIVQVSFTSNTIHFSFDESLSITLESSFVHRRATEQSSGRQTVPVAKSSLMTLIGRTVRFAEGREDGTLTLEFDGAESLSLFDDSDQYEAYKIRIGEEEVII